MVPQTPVVVKDENTSKGSGKVNLSSDAEKHILEGRRVAGSNKLSGGHSPNINNANMKLVI